MLGAAALRKKRPAPLRHFDPTGLLCLPVLIYLALALLVPIALIVWYSFDQPAPTTANYTELFTSPVFRQLIYNTLRIAIGVTIITTLVSYPYAYMMSRAKGKVASILGIAVLFPFLSSSVVRSFTWGVILGPIGPIAHLLQSIGISPPQMIGNNFAVLTGMTQIEFPFLTFPIYAALTAVRPDYLQAAASLGASEWRRFLRITLPLSMPGLVVGMLLVFVSTAGYYVTPQILGGASDQMIGQAIAFEISTSLSWGPACAMGTILLLGTGVLIALVLRIRAVGRAMTSI